MPYTNAQATPRSDIYALVMQANADFNKLFIGDIVFPVKAERARRGIYMKAKLANAELMNADAVPREQGAGYNRINRKYDTDSSFQSEIARKRASPIRRCMLLQVNAAFLDERFQVRRFGGVTFQPVSRGRILIQILHKADVAVRSVCLAFHVFGDDRLRCFRNWAEALPCEPLVRDRANVAEVTRAQRRRRE